MISRPESCPARAPPDATLTVARDGYTAAFALAILRIFAIFVGVCDKLYSSTANV
jgi:hypothetical protein